MSYLDNKADLGLKALVMISQLAGNRQYCSHECSSWFIFIPNCWRLEGPAVRNLCYFTNLRQCVERVLFDGFFQLGINLARFTGVGRIGRIC